MTSPRLDYDLPEADYHAHPALSSTGARRLLTPGCPARFAWERLHPTPPTPAMKLGRAAHREVLGIGSDIVLGDWPNYRKGDAQQWRDDAEAAGLIPLLRDGKDWQAVEGMRDALRRHPVFAAVFDPDRGRAEVSAFWTDEETGVECRARFDFLPNPIGGRRLVVPDYKKARSAEPGAFARQSAEHGYPMQADWYLRGVRACGLDADPAFVFVVQEPVEPYLVTVAQVSPDDLRLAHARNDAALRIFRQCSESGEWSGYGNGVHTLDMPAYWRIESESILEGALP